MGRQKIFKKSQKSPVVIVPDFHLSCQFSFEGTVLDAPIPIHMLMWLMGEGQDQAWCPKFTEEGFVMKLKIGKKRDI